MDFSTIKPTVPIFFGHSEYRTKRKVTVEITIIGKTNENAGIGIADSALLNIEDKKQKTDTEIISKIHNGISFHF